MSSPERFTLDIERNRHRAMISADTAQLQRLLDDRLVYTHSTGVVDDKQSYLAKISTGTLRYRSIESASTRIVDSGTCVLVLDDLTMEVEVQGQPLRVMSRALSVWVPGSAGEWVLLAFHASSRESTQIIDSN